MNLSRPFILRPVATSLFMAAILIFGFAGYYQLPVSALPEVDYPTIQVRTFYPGASSDVMASVITAPLERQFGQTPELTEMTSTSSDGASVITLQFNLHKNIDVAEQEVQAAINAAATFLPTDLPYPPTYNKVNPADAPVMTIALTSKEIPLSKVQDLADTRLAQRISQISGVGLVTVTGGHKPAVRIEANPTALSAYGLTLEDLRQAVTTSNLNRPKGGFDGPRQAQTVSVNDQIESSEGYKPLVIAYRNGAPVLLDDVADVIDGNENDERTAWMNQEPAVILNIQRQPGANIIAVVDRIKALLPQLQKTLPSSVQVSILTDRTATIRASVKDVQFELILTVALVVMVMFLFLRNLSATVIPSVAVPLSIVGAFAIMYLLGYSLNNLTLMALTISTGFVVDDAIVMIENITRFIEAGESPLQAALKGAKQIGFTIISLTISLVAVLIPLLFMGDVAGRLFREFAVTLSVTILVSAVVSLTLTPMMCAKLLRQKPENTQSRFYRLTEHGFNRTVAAYGRSLQWVLRHRTATLLVAAATLVLTLALYSAVPKGFFPTEDTGVILGVSEAPPHTSFAAMARKQEELAAVILQHPAVESLSSFIGVDGTNASLNSGRIQINLKRHDERDQSAAEVIRSLESNVAQVPGVKLYLQQVQDLTVDDRTSRTQYYFSLQDPNEQELSAWTPKLVERLRAFPELRDVSSDQQNGGLRTSLVIDRVTAGRFGITPAMIDNVLYDAFGQRQISTIYTQSNQYRVVLSVAPEFRQDPSALNNIYLRSSQGEQVPLSAIAHFEAGRAPLVVTHQGQFPSATISFNLAPDVSLGEATKKIMQAQREIGMPSSIHMQFGGTARAYQSSLGNESLLILAALVTVYIVLGVLYESYIHPVTILSTLPSAGVGALLALIATKTEFTVIALIGIILLIGIVKKNAIMMIDFALEAQREQHLSADDAIYQACLLRFRPIMMTTMAALLGAVPLAFGTGVGAEFRHPLGITIIGGLLVSQILTLYTTPVIYLWFDELAQRFSSGVIANDGVLPESAS